MVRAMCARVSRSTSTSPSITWRRSTSLWLSRRPVPSKVGVWSMTYGSLWAAQSAQGKVKSFHVHPPLGHLETKPCLLDRLLVCFGMSFSNVWCWHTSYAYFSSKYVQCCVTLSHFDLTFKRSATKLWCDTSSPSSLVQIWSAVSEIFYVTPEQREHVFCGRK